MTHLGEAAGDAILREVAARLEHTCESAAVVARLGGDEFVALLPANEESNARSLAAQLVRSLSAPYAVIDQMLQITASIGVARTPQDGHDAEELLGAADLVLYRAKTRGKARYELFTSALREVAVACRAFEQKLKSAVDNGEFELFYQPHITTQDRCLSGAEALMRWNHPERGLLTPASFIEILSAKPSEAAVGERTLREACRQDASSLMDSGSLKVSSSISANTSVLLNLTNPPPLSERL